MSTSGAQGFSGTSLLNIQEGSHCQVVLQLFKSNFSSPKTARRSRDSPFQRLENRTSSCIGCQAKAREAASAPGMRVLLPAGRTVNSPGKQAGPERASESMAPLTTTGPTLARNLSKSHTKAPALLQLPDSQASESSYSKHLKKVPSQSLPVLPSMPSCLAAGYCPPSQLTKRPRTLLLHLSQAAFSSQAQLPWMELSSEVRALLSHSTRAPLIPESSLLTRTAEVLPSPALPGV